MSEPRVPIAELRVLGLVPARGGSKGIPGKNLEPLAGRPLLAYTADAALAARRLDRVVLSTDDEEIAAVGRGLGLEVPFLRPAELARDDTPTLPVVLHALETLDPGGERFDAVCLLQPTSPLRAADEIDRAIERLAASDADSVVTVAPIPAEHHPEWAFRLQADGRLERYLGDGEPPPRRQELAAAFHRTGSVYVTRRSTLVEHESLYGRRSLGLLVEGAAPLNLDTPADWERAERRLAG